MPGHIYSRLLEFATDHYGYVSTDDARALGISPRRLKLLAERGSLVRIARGLYRFPAQVVPLTSLDQYMEATMWPAGRGVLSHETALAAYGVSDVNPAKVHVTVPRDYRIRRKDVPAVFEFHHADLTGEDIASLEGIQIVSPARAIRDAAHGSHLGAALIAQAIDDAQRTGRLRRVQAQELREELGLPAGIGMRR
jgi:predicted transcriptional regulator of viral defense system